MANTNNYATILLRNQLKELTKNPVDGFSVGLVDDSSVYEWQVMIEGPEDTMYEGGLFPATLSFPQDYPNKPPTMRFTTKDFLHPNVYEDGRVCISILHEAFSRPRSVSRKTTRISRRLCASPQRTFYIQTSTKTVVCASPSSTKPKRTPSTSRSEWRRNGGRFWAFTAFY
eukprot:546805_1